MNITISIDCTPAEAREFLGLPDVTEMQAEMMKLVQERMRAGLGDVDPQELFTAWLPATMKGWEQWQKLFMQAAQSGKKG